MNIEIRRNRTITATFDMEKNKEFVKKNDGKSSSDYRRTEEDHG